MSFVKNEVLVNLKKALELRLFKKVLEFLID